VDCAPSLVETLALMREKALRRRCPSLASLNSPSIPVVRSRKSGFEKKWSAMVLRDRRTQKISHQAEIGQVPTSSPPGLRLERQQEERQRGHLGIASM
jgi:hypothetical protein